MYQHLETFLVAFRISFYGLVLAPAGFVVNLSIFETRLHIQNVNGTPNRTDTITLVIYLLLSKPKVFELGNRMSLD